MSQAVVEAHIAGFLCSRLSECTCSVSANSRQDTVLVRQYRTFSKILNLNYLFHPAMQQRRQLATPNNKFARDSNIIPRKEYLAESTDVDLSRNIVPHKNPTGMSRLPQTHPDDSKVPVQDSLQELSAKYQLRKMEADFSRHHTSHKTNPATSTGDNYPQYRQHNSPPTGRHSSRLTPDGPINCMELISKDRSHRLRGKASGRESSADSNLRPTSTASPDTDEVMNESDREQGVGGGAEDEESGCTDGDVYVFYLETKDGGIVGPLRFDVDDVQIGLPCDSAHETEGDGLRNRQTGSHGLNEFSSRSHSVLTVTIDSETQPDSEDDNLYVTKRGKLSFVDLAGSEKVKDASGGNAVGPGILESNSINKSLLVLGNCISHLADAKRRQGHIPYRDSKLTKLLSDSLGGNGITLMIACITPSSANITETMNTLRYASRAKKIKTKPTVKMDPREKLILSLKREIKVLRNENHYLRQQLDFPAKPKGQLQKENDEKFMKFMKEQQQKESGLYEMLQEYMVENENLRAENSEMHSTRDRIRREQQLLYRENEKLMKRMEDMERAISQNPAFWSAVHHPNRTDGYGQMDVVVPTNQPLLGYQSGHSQKGYPPPVGPASPPGSRGRTILPGPVKPPHRLPEPVMRPAQRPAEVVHNGDAMYPNNGFVSPRLAPRQVSPTRNIERNPSQLSTTDAIHSMNEQLKREVMQLEGEIRHHQHTRGDRGSQDVKRSSVNNSLTAR